MKSKMQKKLVLNKQTIAIIGKEDMAKVQAGDMPFFNFTPFLSLVHCPGAVEKKPSAVPPCGE